MPGRTSVERGREVRQKLLTAASELVPEVGWRAVTTRLIAARAGVTSGLVHYHFESVQALLREATLSVMRTVLTADGPVLGGAETLPEGMDLMLASLDRYTGGDAMSLLFVETYLAATRDEILRRELRALVTDFRRAVATWLAEHGQQMPDQTASVLAAAIDGLILHRALDPRLTSDAVAPVLRRLVGPTPGRRGRSRRAHDPEPQERPHATNQ